MKYIISLIILLGIVSCDLKSAEDYYDEAVELSDIGKWQEAIVKLDKAIELKPTLRIAFIERGFNKAFRLHKAEEGVQDFKKVLAIDPDNTLALYYIGYAYSDELEFEKSIEYLSKALETEGVEKTTKIKINMNIFGDHDSEWLFTVDESEIYYERGMQYVRLKQFNNAITDLNKLVASEAYLKNAYFLLGESYIGKKDTITACKNFQKSATLGDKLAIEMLTKYCTSINEQ